jgi:hypothetical protein
MRQGETSARPVRVIPETEIVKSSNTWEFLQFEQLRGIRFIQLGIFTEMDMARYKILNLILAVNHLETLCIDKLDPSRDYQSKEWLGYQARKPDLFKDFESDQKLSKIRHMAMGDEINQLKLCAIIEKWIVALDRYLQSMKKIDVESFQMYAWSDELTRISGVAQTYG